MIDGYDTIAATYSGSQGNSAAFNINIIPATTVYYEDSFAKFTSGSGAANGAIWAVDGTEKTAEQALEVLGKRRTFTATTLLIIAAQHSPWAAQRK